jgi:hypothetical protein
VRSICCMSEFVVACVYSQQIFEKHRRPMRSTYSMSVFVRVWIPNKLFNKKYNEAYERNFLHVCLCVCVFPNNYGKKLKGSLCDQLAACLSLSVRVFIPNKF